MGIQLGDDVGRSTAPISAHDIESELKPIQSCDIEKTCLAAKALLSVEFAFKAVPGVLKHEYGNCRFALPLAGMSAVRILNSNDLTARHEDQKPFFRACCG